MILSEMHVLIALQFCVLLLKSSSEHIGIMLFLLLVTLGDTRGIFHCCHFTVEKIKV